MYKILTVFFALILASCDQDSDLTIDVTPIAQERYIYHNGFPVLKVKFIQIYSIGEQSDHEYLGNDKIVIKIENASTSNIDNFQFVTEIHSSSSREFESLKLINIIDSILLVDSIITDTIDLSAVDITFESIGGNVTADMIETYLLRYNGREYEHAGIYSGNYWSFKEEGDIIPENLGACRGRIEASGELIFYVVEDSKNIEGSILDSLLVADVTTIDTTIEYSNVFTSDSITTMDSIVYDSINVPIDTIILSDTTIVYDFRLSESGDSLQLEINNIEPATEEQYILLNLSKNN